MNFGVVGKGGPDIFGAEQPVFFVPCSKPMQMIHMEQIQERERSAPLWNSGMTSQERCSPLTTRRS